MFRALIIPNFTDLSPYTSSTICNQDVCNICEEIVDKITIYPKFGKYKLCVVSEENIPESLKQNLEPVILRTPFETPVRAYQQYYYDLSTLVDPEVNRKLMAMRSKLGYSIAENLAPDRFYVQLENPMNDTTTRRQYQYRLFYDEIPCYAFKNDSFIRNLQEATNQQIGPVITSSYAINVMDAPHWYVKEMFRDICELGEFPMEDKVLVEGPASGELYLFYQEETNLTEDMLDQLINNVRGKIAAAIQLKIFPRNTSQEFIKSHQLTLVGNNQWTIAYPIPENIPLFLTLMQQSFVFDTLDQLFWFLTWLALCPTYSFIEPELQIRVQSNEILVTHSTKYLPDYIRVRSASRAKLKTEGQVQIVYPDQLSSEDFLNMTKGTTYLSFYDHANNERAVIIHNNFEIPQIQREYPPDFSLDRRIEYDVDPNNL